MSHCDATEWSLHKHGRMHSFWNAACMTWNGPHLTIPMTCHLHKRWQENCLYVHSQAFLAIPQNWLSVGFCAPQSSPASGRHLGTLALKGSILVKANEKFIRAATTPVRLVRARPWICPLPHSPTLLCRASSMVRLLGDCMGRAQGDPWTCTVTVARSLQPPNVFRIS